MLPDCRPAGRQTNLSSRVREYTLGLKTVLRPRGVVIGRLQLKYFIFRFQPRPSGNRVLLEIADVNDYAKVKLNGKELESHAWQPDRREVANAVKTGSNDLEVQVRATASAREFGGPPPRAAWPRQCAATGFGVAGTGSPGGAVMGFPSASGRACPAPTAQRCRGEARLARFRRNLI